MKPSETLTGKRIRDTRKQQNLTLEDVCRLYNAKFGTDMAINGIQKGLNKGTLSRYETGKQRPMLETLTGLAYVLDVSPEYLLGKSYTPHSEAKTEGLDKTTHSQAVSESVDVLLTKLPLYAVPVSAGAGQWLEDGNDFEYIYVNDVPQGTDFCLRVRGDSMTPMYNDDDIVFVRANVIVESGQIGVFFLNGEGYLKMLQGSKLVSLNSKYKPLPIKEFDSFFCMGRVIGKADGVD